MADAARQLALPFDPIEPRTLPRWGWWTLNARQEGGRLDQTPYRLADLDYVLRHVRRDVDTYMSQAFFDRPNRRAMHMAYATHAYVDLDTYRADRLRGLTTEQIVGTLLYHCRDEGVPLPSVVIASGRGLYLKYFWRQPIPRQAAGRAVAVNRALVRLFGDFGADPAAVDMSRILRVVGTVNTKSGEAARLIWTQERDGAVVAYDFDDFANEVLPYTLDQIRQFRSEAATRRAEVRILSQERARREQQRAAEQRRKGNAKAFCPEDWHWTVLEDVRRLVELRYPGGEVQPGMIDLIGHVGACQLAMVIPAAELWHELRAWSRLYLPADYVDGPLERHASTLLRRAAESRDKVYTYSKARLVELLELTGDEQQHMAALIDDDEKRRRDREHTMAQRRAQGVQERAAYEAAKAAEGQVRAAQAKALRASGLTWQAVAAEMGLSTPDAARLLALRAK